MVIFAGIMTWLYDYGAPIGYTLTATLVTGETIEFGPDVAQVHLAYNQPYAFANQWRMFVDGVARVLISLNALLGLLAAVGGLGRIGYKFCQHFKSKKNNLGPKSSPPKGPPFWPYKFW